MTTSEEQPRTKLPLVVPPISVAELRQRLQADPDYRAEWIQRGIESFAIEGIVVSHADMDQALARVMAESEAPGAVPRHRGRRSA